MLFLLCVVGKYRSFNGLWLFLVIIGHYRLFSSHPSLIKETFSPAALLHLGHIHRKKIWTEYKNAILSKHRRHRQPEKPGVRTARRYPCGDPHRQRAGLPLQLDIEAPALHTRRCSLHLSQAVSMCFISEALEDMDDIITFSQQFLRTPIRPRL